MTPLCYEMSRCRFEGIGEVCRNWCLRRGSLDFGAGLLPGLVVMTGRSVVD
jgi:hypothetical protein